MTSQARPVVLLQQQPHAIQLRSSLSRDVEVVVEEESDKTRKGSKGRRHRLFEYEGVVMSSIREGIASYLFTIIVVTCASTTVLDVGYISIAVGLAYAGVSFLFGGADVNPSFTLARAIMFRIHPLRAVAYFVSQLSGDILAIVTIRFGFSLNIGNAVPVVTIVPAHAAFIAEFIGSYLLCLCAVTLGVARKWRIRTIFVGACYGAVTFALYPLSCACFDIFKAFSIHVFSYFNTVAWIYYVAPICGPFAAVIVAVVLHIDHVHANGEVMTNQDKKP